MLIEKRELGSTGLRVSRLALGGLGLAGRCALGKTTDIIRHAAACGINFIDTAPSYYDSEVQIGNALKKIDAPFIVGTKMGNLPCGAYRPQDREFLRNELNRSLKRLRLEKLDLLYIHEPDRPEMHDWWSDKENYEGPVMDLLREYREKGKVGFFGLGGTTTLEMARIIRTRKFQVVLTAFQYSLLWQEARFSVLPAARECGMGIVCGSALQQGALAQIYRRDVVTRPMRWLSEPRRRQFMDLYEFVHDCGISLPELAIRFVLSNPDVTSLLTGIRSVEELEKNVEFAVRGPLPEELLAGIEEIYRQVPFRPFGEPFGLVFQQLLDQYDAVKAQAQTFIDAEEKSCASPQ